MEKQPSISLIISALNEQSVVGKVLLDIYRETAVMFETFEIIAINDGSTDETGRVMDEFALSYPYVTVIHNKANCGLGASFQLGVNRTKYNYVMLLCGDGGLPASSLPAIYKEVGTKDLVIPYMVNLKRIKTPARYVLSRTYANLLNLLFGFRLRYYNGLPVYRRSLLQAITITSEGFGFQGEILVKLLKSGCTYVQVGVEGAEETGNSSALRLKNIISVVKTFAHLILEITRFKPVPRAVIERGRENNTKT
jgi:glycosyltransferase involved in cell wall biosynthesis